MGLDFVCSWSGSLPVLCPTEPVLVVFSSELISRLSPLVPGWGWRQPAISHQQSADFT